MIDAHGAPRYKFSETGCQVVLIYSNLLYLIFLTGTTQAVLTHAVHYLLEKSIALSDGTTMRFPCLCTDGLFAVRERQMNPSNEAKKTHNR